MMYSFLSLSMLVVGLLAVMTNAAPYKTSAYSPVARRQAASGSERLVFAHFMVGIVPNRKSATDYDDDMKRAKAAGIDAFALNIGTDPYTEQQLGFAYESAEKNDMKVFISFDFNWFAPSSAASTVGGMVKSFGSKKSQLIVDKKVFVSSFAGDGLNVDQVRQAAGMDIYFAPNFHPGQTADASSVDGALNWIAWDSDGNNRAPKPGGNNLTTSQGDETYTKWLGGKGYIAPVSPWFSTHYGPEVSYSKNWVFPCDLLWYNRWNEILELSPRFVEIITWNDYGESHYVGPLKSRHTDDGNSKWVNGMPHNGWLDMAKPFIKAYKAGDMSPEKHIEEDMLVYWYRPTLKTRISATDTVGERPDGHETMEDAVFVVSLLKEKGRVTAVSGKNKKSFDAPAGASAFKVAMDNGKQTFSLDRGGQTVMGDTSLRDVSDQCPCGLYNFNAYVGTVPAGEPDALDKDGLAGFTKGLKDSTCEAKPSITGGGAPKPTATDPAPISSTELASQMTPSSTPAASAVPSSKATSFVSSAAAPKSSSSASPPFSSVAPTAATTTTAQQQYSAAASGCTATVTESSQVAPTNCLKSGQIWGGPNEGPDCCDGASPCCRN
ncbi:glycosyl hydrolase family 71-domain-containing protein [Clohesyomyces aquaticus]|uniref:Glycosyl hydrolase family 71-domain-containing protein n=1 Tax=Clohesyomyces aquaticus TaxID=1231657 RepID=A0A1Y1YJV0_9PLEO|nr:glycosyl hydrolase family 71-domain-containing protein [Clohesyomyces aquaticus]